MTGSEIDYSQLDIRRRKIVYHAWHRGIREMDLVFGQYINAHIHTMSEKTLDEMEFLMSLEDRDLLTYVTGEIPTPAEVDTQLFRDILKHRSLMDFNK